MGMDIRRATPEAGRLVEAGKLVRKRKGVRIPQDRSASTGQAKSEQEQRYCIKKPQHISAVGLVEEIMKVKGIGVYRTQTVIIKGYAAGHSL
jgi:hypothetical protein